MELALGRPGVGRGMEATKPAWMLKQIGNDPNTMAIVPQGEGDSDSESQYNSDNAEDDAENFPPGPVDPEHCSAGGPGFAGQCCRAATILRKLTAPDTHFLPCCRGCCREPCTLLRHCQGLSRYEDQGRGCIRGRDCKSCGTRDNHTARQWLCEGQQGRLIHSYIHSSCTWQL